MIKYFDFEKPIEDIDNKIKLLEDKNDDNEYLINGTLTVKEKE